MQHSIEWRTRSFALVIMALAAVMVTFQVVSVRAADEAGDEEAVAVPPADMQVVTPPAEMTSAARAVFPESYSQFMTVSYERQDAGIGRKPEIWPKDVSFLVPATAFDATIRDELDARVADLIARVLRPGDAHCESVEVGDVEEYGWMAWPDKRVRKITISFNVAC